MIVNENKLENTPTGGALVGKRKGQTMIHNKGSMSGYLVGKTHAEGGIKAINKSTGQPLEMQGGEVVITAPAVSDQTKRNFEGKMMTNRQILSAINERGGGVSFAESGMEIPTEMHFNGTSYNYGGKMLSDHDIAYELSQCGCEHEMKGGGHLAEGFSLRDIAEIHQVPLIELKKQVRLGMKAESEHTASKREQMKIVKDHLFENPNYYTLLKKAGLEHGGNIESLYENENDYVKHLIAFNLADGVEEYKLQQYLKSKGLSTLGLLPDNIKKDPEYIKIKRDFDIAFKRLQNLPKFKYPKNRDRVQEQKDRKKANEISDKIIQIKLKNEILKKGGEVENLSKDAKSGNTPARDLNNYNDVLDVGADGEVGGDTGIYADGGEIQENLKIGIFLVDNDDLEYHEKLYKLLKIDDKQFEISVFEYGKERDSYVLTLKMLQDFKLANQEEIADYKKAKDNYDDNEFLDGGVIRQLGTGANVYFETHKHRLNDNNYGDKGKYILNIGAKEGEYPKESLYFNDLKEALSIAEKIERDFPNGVPEAILLDKIIENYKKENINLDWDTTFTNGFNKGQKLSEQQIETIDVYNDFIYGLTFKNGGLFDATTEQTIGLLSITDNQVNLAVILEKNVDGADYKAITENQKIKRRLHNLAEKSGRIIVINAFKLRSELRQFPYLLVSENDAKIYEVASEFYEKLETPRNEFRKQFTKKLDDEKQNKKEYEYVLTQRPFSIGTYPPQDFVRFEDRDFNYGVLVYSEPIPLKDVEHYSLSPITIIKEYDGKILDYKLGNLKLKARVKLETDNRKGYLVNIFISDDKGVVRTQRMSGVNFLMEIENGKLSLENESSVEPMNDTEITTGYFKVDSENIGFEYAKKINNYFNKWNKIKTLQDKLDFETLDVPMFGSFENETVLDQIERFEKLGFELFANEVVRNDFKKEVRKIIDKKISDREMEKRRYPKEDEEVAKKQKSFESEGSTEGKGKLYEFFTPQVVADKMLALAQHYGFKGGNVLEPATGSGRLIKNLKDTNITAFEISKDNFQILKREFPNAELYNFNFEKAFLKEPRFNTLLNRKGTETWLKGAPFDLVLANPPYGKFSGLYSSYFNFKGQVEHFFILQTLYLLKKGGLGVYLIPSSFLRNGSAYNEIKKQIFEIAEFVDAYRLPSNIFEKTQIGTDILILRKK